MLKINPYQIELFSFLGWLEVKHNKYRSNYCIPIDNTGISVSDSFISDLDFERLVDLLLGYYRLHPGINKFKSQYK
jgi:hypothetical protein